MSELQNLVSQVAQNEQAKANMESVQPEAVAENNPAPVENQVQQFQDEIVEDKLPKIVNDNHLTNSVGDSLSSAMADLDSTIGNLEDNYGEIDENGKMLNTNTETISEELVNEAKRSNFSDQIIEEVEEEKVAAKDEEPSMNLTSIKIKRPKDTRKALNNILPKSLVTQVALPKSGYTAWVTKFTSPELRIMTSNYETLDVYRRTEYVYKSLYEKIENTSAGKLSYVDFLKATGLLELNILYYGAVCSTYPEKNKYPTKCYNTLCGQNFEYEYDNSKLLYLEDRNRENAAQEIIHTVNSVGTTAVELMQNSELNHNTRKLLPKSKHVVEYRHPSLFNHLYDILENIDDVIYVKYGDELVATLPFIDKIYVPEDVNDPESAYMEFTDVKDILQLLNNYVEEDDNAVALGINDIIQSYSIKFGIRNVTCPFCKKVQPSIEIAHVEEMLFMIHQLKLSNE